jgi:hypothetical protein
MNEQATNNLKKKLMLMLIIIGAAICLPFYIGLLVITGDSFFSASSYRKTSKTVVVKRIGDLDFATAKRIPIQSIEELFKALVLTVEPLQESTDEIVYLRSRAFDTFSDKAMNTEMGNKPADKHTDFISENSRSANRKALSVFYSNFEPRLPYWPCFARMAGPLNYSLRADSSILLEYSIAVGDEFEIEFVPTKILNDQDRILQSTEENDRMVSLNGLREDKIKEIAENLAPDTEGVAAVIKFKKALERKGIYSLTAPEPPEAKENYFGIVVDPLPHLMHPVEIFLQTGMKGHCQHFASALVALCRAKGIPARVAVGLVSGVKSEGRFLFVDGMAHAWAEILTTDGWKIVDPSPERSEVEPAVKPGFKLPGAKELDKLKKELQQKNKHRYSPEEENQPRNKNEKISDATRPELPGSIVPDKDKQQKARDKAKKEQRERIKRYVKAILPPVIFILTVFVFRKKLKAFLKKILAKMAKESKEEEDQPSEKTRIQLIKQFKEAQKQGLTGKNLSQLFTSFCQLMKTNGFEREKHETPNEYFNRIRKSILISENEAIAATRFLETEVYAKREISPENARKFVDILDKIIKQTNSGNQ